MGATFTNNGTFENGTNAVCNVRAEFVNSKDATFKNGNGAECNLENSENAVFTNNGTFENGANAACNVGATFTNNGTFENENASFAPVPGSTFFTPGRYQEMFTRTSLHIMETRLSDGQVLHFEAFAPSPGNWKEWTNGTKVTLYGGKGPYTFGDDATPSILKVDQQNVTLDLNGQKLNLGDKFFNVSGFLKLLDSAGGGTITSTNAKGAIQRTGNGDYTVQPGITISSPTEPPATETESGKTPAAAPAQKSEDSLTPTPEPGAGEGAKTETGAEETKPEAKAEEKADAKPEAKVEEKADAKPEEKVEEEAAAAQGTGSEQ